MRYGPGGSCRRTNWPDLSDTANAVVPPSAEITTPSSGRPASSRTVPSMWPLSDAARLVMRSGPREATICAFAWLAASAKLSINAGTTRPLGVPIGLELPTRLRSLTEAGRVSLIRSLRRFHVKVHVPRQGLVGRFVGDLDRQAVRAFPE